MRSRILFAFCLIMAGAGAPAPARLPQNLYPGVYSSPGAAYIIEVGDGGAVWLDVYGQRMSLGRLSVGDSYSYDVETTVVTPVRRREWRNYPGIGFSETTYYENVESTIVTTYTIRAEWNDYFQVPVFGIYENNRHQHTLMTPWARLLDDTGRQMPARADMPFEGALIYLHIDVDAAAYWWISAPEWCLLDVSAGRGPRTVAMRVSSNSGGNRDAVVSLHHESGPRAQFMVRQAGRPIFIRSAVQLAGRRALKVEYGVPVSSEVSVKIRNDAEVLTTGENVEGALGNVGPGERHELVWTPDFEGEGMLWTNMTVELTARNAAETNAIFGPLRFDGRTLRLRVVSAVDGVQPPAGLHEYFWGAFETCEAPAYHGAVADGRVLVCDGWRGLGSVPAAGDGTQTIVAVTNLYSEISWRWRTNTAFTAGRPQMVLDGGDRMDVVYDLHDPEGRPHSVTLAWRPSDRGEWLPCLNATGATGVAVLPGIRNLLRWHFVDEWSDYTGTAEFRLHVTDGIFEEHLSVGAWTNRPHALAGLTARQRVGTKMVDVEFDLGDPDPFGLPVRMEYSQDGATWKPGTQAAPGAAAVFPGRAALVWNGAADCDLYTGTVFLRISVDDGEYTAVETVGLNVDFADTTLLIVSPFGGAVPPPGPNLFPVNASVRCHVETPVQHGEKWYVCRGWTGAGSVPASGSMADTGEFVLSEPDNSLTWLWETLEIADVSARQLPGTRLVEIEFDVRSPYGETMLIETASEADGEAIDMRGLSGAAGVVAAAAGRYTLTWDAGEDWPLRHGRLTILLQVADALNRVHATVDVEVDTRDYVLNVISSLSDCDPAPGIHRLPWGTSIVCRAPERVETAAGAVRLAGALLKADDASSYPLWLSSAENEVALTARETVLHWHWRAAAPETPVLEIAQIPGRKALRAIVQSAGGAPDVAVPVQVMLLETNIPFLPVSMPAALTEPLVVGETESVEIELADLVEDGTYGSLAFRVGGALRAYPESVDADAVLVEAGINTGVDPDGMAYECALTEPLMVSRHETRVIELAAAVNWGLREGRLTVWSNQVVTVSSTAPLWRFDATGPLALSNGFVYVAKGLDQYPAANMTWYGAACYANLRSLMEGFEPAYDWDDWRRIPAANGYRLPTASEWEYLYRGGLRDKRFPWGNHVTHEYANYNSWGDVEYDLNPTRGLHPEYRGPAPVGGFAPNAFGLFDMAGNVAEWLDHFRPNTYREDWQPWWDPARPASRRAGGGHAYSGARNLRPNQDVYYLPHGENIGCRLVRPALENAAQAEVSFDARDYRFTVDGNRSNVGLSDGTHVFAWGAAIEAHAGATATAAGVTLRCAGWVGSGSVPPSGNTAAAGIIDLLTPDSGISWLYVPFASPAIHDLSVAQRPGTGLLDIAFRLAGMPDGGVKVAIRSADDDRLLATIPAASGMPGNHRVAWDAGPVLPEGVASLTVSVQALDSVDPDAGGGMAVIPRSALAVSTADGREEYMLAVREPVEIDRFEVMNDEMMLLLQWALQHDLIEVVSNFVWNTVGEPRPLLHVGPDFAIDWQPPNFVFSPSVQGAGFPCGHVSWYGAAAYCNWRSLREGLTPCYDWEDWSCDVQANGYRLPTGVEWELAARGGETRADYPWGDTITHMHANFNRHPDFRDNWPPTSPPGTFGTNAYGLADVCGNVSEWLEERTVTGGSYYWSYAPALSLRPWNRYAYHGATTMASHIGFRTLRRHVPAEASASAAGVIDTRPYVLDIFSAHGGNPQPGTGRHVHAWGSVVTGQVRRVTVEWPVEYNLTGWTGSGIDPVTGNANVAVFALTAPFAVLNWQWDDGTVIDSAGNGLRDAWELKYFGGIGLTGRDDDPDGDGYTNWEEYVMGTDPNDPDSTLSWRIDNVPGDEDAIEALIQIPAAGRWFDLQTAPDLMPPVQWQSLARFSGTGDVRRITLPSGSGKRFFRLTIGKEQP